MSSLCKAAFYGKGKKLREDTWRGIGADIERRLGCGDLDSELRFLSFADRPVTAEGWQVLEKTLPQFASCWTLDLQRCGINDVTKLARLMPRLAHLCKRVDASGNRLSAKSVRKLADAMTSAFAHIRPVWLCIGEDAAEDAPVTCSPCHPYHEKGCLCARQSVVHVVRKLAKYDVADKARWEEEHLRPLEYFVYNRAGRGEERTLPAKIENVKEWPPLVPAQLDDAPAAASESTRASVDGCSQAAEDSEDWSRNCSPDPEVVASLGPPPQEEARQAPTLNAQEAFASYFQCERRAQEMEVMRSLAELGKIFAAPLEAAARFTRQQAAHALVELRASCGSLTCVLVGERLLMLAAGADARLLLIDLTESASRGAMVDLRGAPACGAQPLDGFTSRAKALPFEEARADQHELRTVGGEELEICLDHRSYLLSGWVAARVNSESAFLWFPIDRCCVAHS